MTAPPDRAAGIRFRLLGPFEAWHGERRLILGGKRPERLLACLLLEAGHTVTVDQLVDAVWDDHPPSTAAHQVRKLVAHLRLRLAPADCVIVTDGPGYRIDADPEQLDLGQFRQRTAAAAAVAAACPDEAVVHLRAGLRLWRGPALSGMSGQAIAARALVLDDSRLAAIEQLAAACLASGRAAEVVTDLTAVVGQHPLAENLRAQLVLALYRCGRRADALAAYEAGRRVLRDQLGVDPGPGLKRLHDQLLRDDPELAAQAAAPAEDQPSAFGVPSTLPYDISDFTGRHRELSALSSIIPAASRAAVMIVTVDGMAGVGKTSLAIHAAHQLSARFPDGHLFLDLLGCTENQRPMDPLDALDRLLRAVGVPAAAMPLGLDDRSALWRSRIAGRSMVLLLDNAASAAQVRPLLPGQPGSVVLVTSRARLAGLDGVVPVSLAPPSHDDCLAIVRKVLGEARVEAEAAAVDDLVKMCGHLPLAVRLAAARLRARPSWTVGDLLTRLRDAVNGVRELTVDDRSVEAAFQLSYDSLEAPQQRLFRLLGLLPTVDFTAADAAVITGLSRLRAQVLLEHLLDARLIEQRSSERYRFHDLLRAYAHATARRVEPPAECERVLRTVYEAMVGAVRHCVGLIHPGSVNPTAVGEPGALRIETVEQALTWLDAELDNIVAATRAAGALGLPEYAVALGAGIADHLDQRSCWTAQAELLDVAVASARRIGDRNAELRAEAARFQPLWRQGRAEEASASAEEATRLARVLGDRRLEAVCLRNIGALLRGFGQYQQSLDYHGRAIRIHRETGDRRSETSALLSLGQLYGAVGDHHAALDSAEQALRIMGELGYAEREVGPLVDIGVAQAGLGRLAAAESTLRSALRVARRVGTPHGIALAELNLAKVLLEQTRVEDALDRVNRATAALAELNAPAIAADLETTRGRIHLVRGAPEAATAAFEAALQHANRANDQGLVAAALEGLDRT